MRYEVVARSAVPVEYRAAWAPMLLVYAGLALVTALLFAEPLRVMATTWVQTTAFNHCPFVPLVSLFLVWRKRAALSRIAPEPSAWALPLLALALLGWLVGFSADVMLVQQLAFVAVLVTLVPIVWGWRATRMLAFPLGFLFLMVPFGEGLIPPLQDFTAGFAVRALRLVNVPIYQEGVLISTPSGLFEVAAACAGLRFLIANLMVALLFAYLSYRRPWKWIVFLAFAVVVPIIANAIRATGIIYIAYLTDNTVAVGVDHVVYGWGFFALIMALLLFVGNLFADPPTPHFVALLPLSSRQRPISGQIAVPALALILLVGVPAYAATAMRLPSAAPLIAMPTLGVGAEWERAATGSWHPQFVGADLVTGESYVNGADRVDVFVGYYAFQRPGAEIVQEGTRYADGHSWVRVGAGQHELKIADFPEKVHLERLVTTAGERRIVLAWYWVDHRFTGNPIVALLLRALERMRGTDPPAAIIAMSAPFEDRPAEALAAIERFLSSQPKLRAYLDGFAAAQAPPGES